jgi:CRP-like cAMP-binding protein
MTYFHSIAKAKSFKKGEAVFHLGQRADYVFSVIRGEVHLYRHSNSGNRILIHRAYSGDYFAEASIRSPHYHCTAVCVKDSDVRCYSSQELLTLIQKNSDFAMSWIELISAELRKQRANSERLHLKLRLNI